VVKRRERTRQLIELGGLVSKARLIELTFDDRTVIFGLLIAGAAKLRGNERENAMALWRRLGKRAFEVQSSNNATGGVLPSGLESEGCDRDW
jgi:hypothetical protein